MLEKIEEGDHVKLSEKALSEFTGSFKQHMKKMVYRVERKDASVFQGVILYLHCGTTLKLDEAVKVSKDIPLYT